MYCVITFIFICLNILFANKHSSSICKLLRSEGTEPVSILLYKCKCRNCVSVYNVCGIVPVNLLLDKYKCCSVWTLIKLFGIVAVK